MKSKIDDILKMFERLFPSGVVGTRCDYANSANFYPGIDNNKA